MKKLILGILICVFSISLFGFKGGSATLKVIIRARGEVVLKGEYTINPDITQSDIKVLAQSVDIYGEKGILDYMFFDLGSDIANVYDTLDTVSISDCVYFVPKSREKFIYDETKASEWVVRDRVVDKVFDCINRGVLDIELEFCRGDTRYDSKYLRECTELVASYSTNYSFSNENRKKNIVRASNLISGLVLDSGDTFSFNQVVGARTIERGFCTAKVIIDGNYVDGVGGGVCQVATTLYNTALRADMRVDKCTRHTLAPSYVPLSFDAMVSEWSDLVFTNTTNYPLFIEIIADGERLTAKAYSKKRDYTLRFESVITQVVNHDLYDGTNGDRYRNGYKSEGYKVVQKGDKVVEKERIRRDYYKPYVVTLPKPQENSEKQREINTMVLKY